MLERLRQFEGADQIALYEPPQPNMIVRVLSALRRLIVG